MAKPTKFVRACRAIEAAIEAATRNGAGSHKTRGAMMRDLAYWATTDYAGHAYEHISKLKLPWKRWDTELYWPGMLVAATIRLSALDHMPLAKASNYIKVPDADIREATRLLKSAGLTRVNGGLIPSRSDGRPG